MRALERNEKLNLYIRVYVYILKSEKQNAKTKKTNIKNKRICALAQFCETMSAAKFALLKLSSAHALNKLPRSAEKEQYLITLFECSAIGMHDFHDNTPP